MISGGDESVLIGGPGQSDLLAFGSDEVRSSLVGVAGFVSDGLLGVGFIAGCTVGSGVAPFAAAIFVADIGGWHDGDVGLGGVSQVTGCSNGNGQESGDDKQFHGDDWLILTEQLVHDGDV